MPVSLRTYAVPFCSLLAAAGVLNPAHAENTARYQSAAEPMVVTGSRTQTDLSDSVVQVEVITAEDIDKAGASNLAEALESSAVVKITPSASGNPEIEIQGFSSEHVLVLVNGQRVNGRIEGVVDLRRINTANILQVEVVRGPSSALYGSDALGGVINIITDRTEKEATVGVRANSQGSVDVSLQGGLLATDNVLVNGSATLSHTESYDLDESTSGKDGPENDRVALAFDASWDISDDLMVDADVSYQQQDRLAERSGIGGGRVDYANVIDEWRVSVRPELELNGLHLSGLVGWSRYSDHFVQDVYGTANGDSDEVTKDDLITVGGQADMTVKERHQLTLGVENQVESLSSERLEKDSHRSRTAVYLQDQISEFYGQDNQASLGLRFDGDTQFGSKTTGKASFARDVSDSLKLMLGVGQGFRAPDFKQLYLLFINGSQGYIVRGNSELLPEETESINLGFNWNHNSWVLESNAYYHDVENLIETVEIPSTTGREFTYQNVSRARLLGVDNQLSIVANPDFDLGFFYSYLNAKDQDTGSALSGRAKHRAGTSATWSMTDRWDLSGDLVWSGKRHLSSTLGRPGTSNGEAPAYTQFSVQAAWEGDAWRFLAGVKNIFDEGESEILALEPRRGYIEFRRSF